MPQMRVEDAVRRNCEALLQQNVAQLMYDMTPQAAMKMMQVQAESPGGGTPALYGFDISGMTQEGDDYLFDVLFSGEQDFSVKARWRAIGDEWKLADFDIYPVEA